MIATCLLVTSIAGHAEEKATTMTKSYKPEGIQSLMPFVYVENVPEYLEFVKAAFGVEVVTETKNDEATPRSLWHR